MSGSGETAATCKVHFIIHIDVDKDKVNCSSWSRGVRPVTVCSRPSRVWSTLVGIAVSEVLGIH